MVSRNNLKFAALGCIGIAGMFVLGLIRPYAFREDGYVEGATAVLFALSMMWALYRLVCAHRAHAPMRRQFLIAALAGFAGLLFLSEISFGARIFSLQMPRIPGGGEFDGGHDFVIVIYRFATSEGRTPAAIAIAAFIVIAAATLAWQFRGASTRRVRHILTNRFAFRLAWILSLLALAVGLDLVRSPAATLLEEAIEFCVSVMYAFMLFELRAVAQAAAPHLAIQGSDKHLFR